METRTTALINRILTKCLFRACLIFILLASSANDSFSQKLKMTSLAFGGNGVCFTRFKDQLAVMAGGRGSATFNDRFTLGGGGWGMMKGVSVVSDEAGIYKFAKMGYGGIDFGYLILPGEKLNFGTKVLLGGGAAFIETVPDTKEKYFRMFTVAEPGLYSQVTVSKLFRIEAGASYRMIGRSCRPYVSARELSGFSCYIGFLISAGN